MVRFSKSVSTLSYDSFVLSDPGTGRLRIPGQYLFYNLSFSCSRINNWHHFRYFPHHWTSLPSFSNGYFSETTILDFLLESSTSFFLVCLSSVLRLSSCLEFPLILRYTDLRSLVSCLYFDVLPLSKQKVGVSLSITIVPSCPLPTLTRYQMY